MATVRFQNHSCELIAGESVLDGLLRHGVAVPHACKAGSCGSCLMRAAEGEAPAAAQAGLKDSWKARGYFLACQCQPDRDLAVAEVGGDARVAAIIASLERLSPDVLLVRLLCEGGFAFRAGQYVTLVREDNLARSYSIANLPGDGRAGEGTIVELHVRLIPDGRMSGWLAGRARPGTRVHLLGPSGECFYVPGREEQPIVLAGAGTGLAPLYGILRDALAAGHRGEIHLFHGAVRPAGLYLSGELLRMAAANENFRYTPAVLSSDEPGPFEVGPIDRILTGRLPKLEGWRGFVCGDPGLVRSLRKTLFLSGMSMRDIYSDSFQPAV
ncbi:MAG: 2Fe-2S iron-sulfur cluster-binding protein [Bryobacteraceae bacterium]